MKIIGQRHLPYREYNRCERKVTFCCEVHEMIWEEELQDLIRLNQIEYKQKYGVDLQEGSERIENIVHLFQSTEPIVRVYWSSVLEREIEA